MSNATIEASPSQIGSPDLRGAPGGEPRQPRKRVLVLMPFGGETRPGGAEEAADEQREAVRVEQRRAVLEFLRLRYLLGKLSAAGPYAFDAEVAYTLARDISANALAKVGGADVVIAVLHHRNLNVMYEVAVRHLLRDEMILIVKGQPNEELPVYLRDKAYIVSDPIGEVSPTGRSEEIERGSEPLSLQVLALVHAREEVPVERHVFDRLDADDATRSSRTLRWKVTRTPISPPYSGA